jgi:pyridoxamine 5'-phosphate oxidase
VVDFHRREQYAKAQLLESDVAADPLVQLQRWLDDAEAAQVAEPNAMVVVTVDSSGRPRPRNVLLRGLDDDGRLSFFTNRLSRKGQDLAQDERVAVLFSWLDLERQVRIQGTAAPLEEADSDAYFATRPRESQVGAWASEQSTVVPDRAAVDAEEIGKCLGTTGCVDGALELRESGVDEDLRGLVAAGVRGVVVVHLVVPLCACCARPRDCHWGVTRFPNSRAEPWLRVV